MMLAEARMAASPGAYRESLTALTLGLLDRVLVRRAPWIAHWMSNCDNLDPPSSCRDATAYLQAVNIRFQLLRIVDESAKIRERRLLETSKSQAAIPDSFAAHRRRPRLDRLM